MKKLLSFWSLLFACNAFCLSPGHRVDCVAKVALNRVYTVHVDTNSKYVEVKNDAGFLAQGNAVFSYSPSARANHYFLGLTHTSGILVEFEVGGNESIALCLKENECYLCK